MTVTGETGYLGLQTNLDEKLAHDEDVVVNTALPGKSQMLAFICPETQGSYRGFAYDAVAISYYNDAVMRLLDSSAFEGNASNYVIYPDGRVVIDNSVNRTETIYTSLRCCATIPIFPRRRSWICPMPLHRAAAET